MQKLSASKQTQHGELAWWVNDPNSSDCPFVGPYSTQAEAKEAIKGLTRFYEEEMDK